MDFWKEHLKVGLDEDNSKWDWCTLSVGSKQVRAQIRAKQDFIMAFEGLIPSAQSLSRELGQEFKASKCPKDGLRVKKGSVVCEWRGPARSVLSLERLVLNLAGYVSGVATQTRELVDRVERSKIHKKPRIAPTRKILPYYRDIALHGVWAGGGHLHRVSAAGGVLIKENHIKAKGSLRAAVDSVRLIAPHGLKIETEVRNLKELVQALDAGVDAVLLDNFTPDEVKKGLRIIEAQGSSPVVEVSGGIRAENIHNYLIEGVDVISMGALTHSVRCVDLSLVIV